jgi:glycine/D-amino acid oxidase-like deaminating enzyme
MVVRMNVSSEKSVSLWMSTKVLDDAPVLDKGEKADVVIIGSGIAGMSVAWELAKAGKDVVVLDRGPIGKGMTSRTTAHLTAQCDDGFHQLIGRRGEDIAKSWYQSQAASIDRIRRHRSIVSRPTRKSLALRATSVALTAICSTRPAPTPRFSTANTRRRKPSG